MGRKKRGTRKVTFCYYCMKTFTDEKSLVEHQKSKHFRCPACNKKMNAAGALYVHCNQVHKNQLDKVPNSIDGHDTFEVDVYGMQHVPETAVHEYMEMHGMGEQVQRAKKARNDQEVAARQAALSAAAAPAPAAAAAFPPGAAYPGHQQTMYAPPPQAGMYHPGMPPHGMPPHGMPPHGMPPQAFSPHGMPGMPYNTGAHPGAFMQPMQPQYGMPPGAPSGGFHPPPFGASPNAPHVQPSPAAAAAAASTASQATAPSTSTPMASAASAMSHSAGQPASAAQVSATVSAVVSALSLPSPAPAAAAPPAQATGGSSQTQVSSSTVASSSGAASVLSPATFGRHAVASKDSILVYGDDLVSPEERRASMPKYGSSGPAGATEKLQSLDADIESRLAKALE